MLELAFILLGWVQKQMQRVEQIWLHPLQNPVLSSGSAFIRFSVLYNMMKNAGFAAGQLAVLGLHSGG
ncbi:MAG: hypothetical protein Fur0046_14890 [Cyanobacteria bacterium J069]|nr:MAG: hypothetical protein D6742_15995 [Cyanobacteria bacterium J069]